MSKVLSALLVTLGLLLLTAGQAHAAAQCNTGPINEAGDINIAPSFPDVDCVVSGDVTGGGYIRINAPLGKITITGNITTTNHGNVVLSAGGAVSVGGSIIVNNASAPLGQAGSVDVKANMAGSGSPFVIGASGANGVGGSINTDTALGGGTDPFVIRGGIRIRNRNDITVTSMSALSVKGTSSRSGVIILEAVDGTLSLPTGTLSADGQPGGQSAGAIVLMAHAITTQSGTIISASDSIGQASHFVNVAAGTISYQGTGLTIRANGGGSTSNGTGSFVYALPEFGVFVTDDSSSNPGDFTWTVTYPFGTGYPGALTWNGAAGSPLTVTANGTTNTQLLMSGYPLTFNGGDTLLAARGQQSHVIQLTYTGSTNGSNGLVVNASKLTLNANANANAGTGGDIFVGIPKPVSSSPQQVLMTADGPTGATGDGGTIDFFANGDITLGGSAGQFHLSAQGGTPGGNGGSVNAQNNGHATDMASATAVQVSARGGNGNGGIFNSSSNSMAFAGSGLKVSADAMGTGKGGELLLDVQGPITVGSGTGEVKLSAEANSMTGGDGGQITITANSAAITAGQLSVASGPMGSGGKIGVFTGGELSLTGSLKADAGSAGQGQGGEITLNVGQLVLNGGASGGGQSLSADGAGSGKGGTVAVTVTQALQASTIAKQQNGAVAISADGGKNATGGFVGAGGTIALEDLNEGFVITGAALSVKSGPNQNAGNITVDAGQTLAVSGDIHADGTGNGANGGTIRLTADSSNPVVFSGTSTTNIIADGGSSGTTGNGGHITISNAGTGDIVFQQKVVLSAAAEGTSGGTAGTVTATTAGNIVFGGVGSRIKANGNGVTGVDNILLESTGGITIGTGTTAGEIELLARGNAPGHQGGSVNVKTLGPLTVAGGSIDTRAGANGNGGSITAKGQKLTVNNTAVLAVDGRGTGFPGTITLTQTGPDVMMLDNATISASGDPNGNASGHDITITNSGGSTVSMNGTTLNASASLTGNGFGGSVHISTVTGNPAQINLAAGAHINAKGAQDGFGGVVVVSNAGPFDVNAVIKVDGGLGISPSDFDGSITLNLIECRQWKTTYDWPQTFWNCTGNVPLSDSDKRPAELANALPGSLKTLLAGPPTQVYVFSVIDDLNSFFVNSQPAGAAGLTFRRQGEASIYTSTMENAFVWDPSQQNFDLAPLNEQQIKQVTAHELGHAVDITVGMKSFATPFTTFVRSDLSFLDYSSIDPNSEANSTRRDPCVPTMLPGGAIVPAPFDGVVDYSNGQPLCTNGTIEQRFAGMRNSEILKTASIAIITQDFNSSGVPGWPELYAHSFGFELYTNTLATNDYLESSANGTFHTGYFLCTRIASDNLLGLSVVPPAECFVYPSWYLAP